MHLHPDERIRNSNSAVTTKRKQTFIPATQHSSKMREREREKESWKDYTLSREANPTGTGFYGTKQTGNVCKFENSNRHNHFVARLVTNSILKYLGRLSFSSSVSNIDLVVLLFCLTLQKKAFLSCLLSQCFIVQTLNTAMALAPATIRRSPLFRTLRVSLGWRS